MWPDERVARFVHDNFLAARVHPRQNPDAFKQYSERYGAPWTPTILLTDRGTGISAAADNPTPLGLPVVDRLPIAMWYFRNALPVKLQGPGLNAKSSEIAIETLEIAPEALYWAGVAPYKATGNPVSLKATGQAFKGRYQDTPWAKKASVWT